MRYIPLTASEKAEMLSVIGADGVEELFGVIPAEFRLNKPLELPGPTSEMELARKMKNLSERNRPASTMPSFLGGGSYKHFIPSAVDHLVSRSEWYSAYTPYQPEISQGTLQAIYEFQSYVCALFGTDVANASMYDGASAMAEAALMARRITKKREIVVSDLVHPRWREVTRTYSRFHGVRIVETADYHQGRVDAGKLAELITDDTAAVAVQSPNFFGNIENLAEIAELCEEKKILLITGVAEAMSLGLLKPPGEFGADIVVGEGQSLGLPQSFGGPYLGLFGTKQKYLRQMPGRLCGRTTDLDGKTGFVLTLAAREQHIRREKATSNICSNQALCALRTAIYLSLMGKTGLAETARANFYAAVNLKERIDSARKVSRLFDIPFFNEQLVRTEKSPAEINSQLAEKGVVGGLDVSRFYPDMTNCLLLTATETTRPEDLDILMDTLES